MSYSPQNMTEKSRRLLEFLSTLDFSKSEDSGISATVCTKVPKGFSKYLGATLGTVVVSAAATAAGTTSIAGAVCSKPKALEGTSEFMSIEEMKSIISSPVDQDSDDRRLVRKIRELHAKHALDTKGFHDKLYIDKSSWSKIQNGIRRPGRDVLLCIALCYGLTIHDAKELLGLAGYGVSIEVRRDVHLMYALVCAMSIEETHEMLEAAGMDGIINPRIH